jgi:hypothetical protein
MCVRLIEHLARIINNKYINQAARPSFFYDIQGLRKEKQSHVAHVEVDLMNKNKERQGAQLIIITCVRRSSEVIELRNNGK